jgi:phosphomannomutase/phosphoglucomutase
VGHIYYDTQGIERYLASIISHVDRDLIRDASLRVVLDCGNGTSAITNPTLLRRILGGPFISLNANPDGSFPGHPSEPTDENLHDLKQAVLHSGAELGIALDGDADRVSFVDETGQFVPGEVGLALFAKDVLHRHQGSTLVTSVTSSQAVEDVVRQEGGKLLITKSGSLPVAEGIAHEKAPFGGEENGHYYWPEHQNAPDGPMSSAMMLELLARTRKPLSELVSELPRYEIVKKKVPLPRALRDHTMARVLETLSTETERVVTLDGVKAFWPDGWLLVRPSGTEPICRIFSESKDPKVAHRLSRKGVDLVQEIVSQG